MRPTALCQLRSGTEKTSDTSYDLVGGESPVATQNNHNTIKGNTTQHYTVKYSQHIGMLELVRNLMAHGDAREGKWRGNWRMEWVASTLTPPPNMVYPALLKLMCTPRLLAVDWTDAPTDLNGLVRFGERRNVVSARVPSRSARAIHRTANPAPHSTTHYNITQDNHNTIQGNTTNHYTMKSFDPGFNSPFEYQE